MIIISINNFNYYRVNPVMKIDNNKSFIKKDSNSKQSLKKDDNLNNLKNNDGEFAKIYNEYFTKKK